VSRQRIYVGLRAGVREVFTALSSPTEQTHGRLYGAVVGPFRTRRAAELVRDTGAFNPHVQTVADAERSARWAP
jgi:hypothetical protein